MPLCRVVAFGVMLLVVVLVVLVTPQYWWGNYGYYVPHWTYEGWGGPKYWKKLTNNEDTHMDRYGWVDARVNES